MIDMENISSLVPHRGKMLLLSKVNAYNLQEERIEAEYHLTENCLFYDPVISGVPAWVGFEFMAQAISALSGIEDRENGRPPRMGFILSVSAMRIGLPFFGIGSTAQIKAKEIDCVDSVSTFEGEIFLDGRKVLEGKLTVMEANDEKVRALKEGRNASG